MSDKRLDILEATLKQVIDWLKFAESKNGALVAVGCAVIFGAYRTYSFFSGENGLITAYILSLLSFVAASVVISLASFIPRMTPPFWIKMPKKEKGDNMICDDCDKKHICTTLCPEAELYVNKDEKKWASSPISYYHCGDELRVFDVTTNGQFELHKTNNWQT